MGYYEELFSRYGILQEEENTVEQGTDAVTKEDLEIAAFLEGARPKTTRDPQGRKITQWFMPDGTPVSIDYVETGPQELMDQGEREGIQPDDAQIEDPYLKSVFGYLDGPLYGASKKTHDVAKRVLTPSEEGPLTIERAPEMGNVPIYVNKEPPQQEKPEEESSPFKPQPGPEDEVVIERAPEMGNIPIENIQPEGENDLLSRIGNDLKLGLEETVKIPVRSAAYLSSVGWDALKLLPAAVKAVSPEQSEISKKAEQALEWMNRQQQIADEIYEKNITPATDKNWDLAKSLVWGGVGSSLSQLLARPLIPVVQHGLRYLPRAIDVGTAMIGDKLVVNPLSEKSRPIIEKMDIDEEKKNLVRAFVDIGLGLFSGLTLENALTRLAERPDRYFSGASGAFESLFGRSPKARAEASFRKMVDRMIADELIPKEQGEQVAKAFRRYMEKGGPSYAERIRADQGSVDVEGGIGKEGQAPSGQNLEQSTPGKPGYREGTPAEVWKGPLKSHVVEPKEEAPAEFSPLMGRRLQETIPQVEPQAEHAPLFGKRAPSVIEEEESLPLRMAREPEPIRPQPEPWRFPVGEQREFEKTALRDYFGQWKRSRSYVAPKPMEKVDFEELSSAGPTGDFEEINKAFRQQIAEKAEKEGVKFSPEEPVRPEAEDLHSLLEQPKIPTRLSPSYYKWLRGRIQKETGIKLIKPDIDKAPVPEPIKDAARNSRGPVDSVQKAKLKDEVVSEMVDGVHPNIRPGVNALLGIPGMTSAIDPSFDEDGNPIFEINYDNLFVGAAIASLAMVGGRRIKIPKGAGITQKHPTVRGVYLRGEPGAPELKDNLGPYLNRILEAIKPGKSTVVKDEEAIQSLLKWDLTHDPEQLRQYVENMKYVEPYVTDKSARISFSTPDPVTGLYGNEKMKFPNEAFPRGRVSLDFQGCGRGTFARLNGLEGAEYHPLGFAAEKPCYGGKCYAATAARIHGAPAFEESIFKRAIKGEKRKEIIDFIEAHGIDEARKKWPDLVIDTGKYRDYSIARIVRGTPEGYGATVSTKIPSLRGLDVRLGVNTDGGAWLSKPEVLDALLKADPQKLVVFSSAYHPPPPPHELSKRTVINVTISGFFPLPEQLHRLRYAIEARKNGWNTVLRYVSADPKKFTQLQADLYNRAWTAVHETDFGVMQQPLHSGAVYGDPISHPDYPACCVGSEKHLHTCDSCQVAEFTGRGALESAGIRPTLEKGEEGRIWPDLEPEREIHFDEAFSDSFKVIPKEEITKGFPSHPLATLGAVAGVEVDDEGNVTINPEKLALGMAAGAGIGAGLAKRESLRKMYLNATQKWDKHFAEPVLDVVHRIVDHSITNEHLRSWLGMGYDPRIKELKKIYNIRAADILDDALEFGRKLVEIAPTKVEQKRLFQVMEGGITVDPVYARKAEEIKEKFDKIRERAKELELLHWTQFDKLTRKEVNKLREFVRGINQADTPGKMIAFAQKHDIPIPGKIPVDVLKRRLEKKGIQYNPDAEIGEIYDLAREHGLHENTQFQDRHLIALRDSLLDAQREAAVRLWHYDHTYKAGTQYMPHLYEFYEGMSPGLKKSLEKELSEIHAQMVKAEPNTPEREELENQYYTLKDILERGPKHREGDFVSNPFKMSLGWAKARMTLPPEAQKYLQPIEEAAYSAATGLGRQKTDLLRREFLETLSLNPDWVRDPKNATGSGWKVVRGNQWGPLNGKAVRRTVLSDLEDIIDNRSAIMKVYDNLLGRWKFGKTVLDPKVWARNIRSNIMLAWWADLPPWDLKTYKKAYDEFRSKGELYQKAKDEGLFSNTFVQGELKKLRDEFENLRTNRDAVYWVKKALSLPAEYYQDIEHYFKLAVFIRHIKDGKTPQEAARVAEKALFNYMDIPPIVKHGKRLIPFLTWTWKIIPRFAETAIKRPWKVAAMAGAIYGLEALAAQKMGLTFEELQKKRDTLESWRRKKIFNLFPAFAFVPFENKWGNPLMLDLTYEMPFGTAGEQWGQSRLPFRDLMISNPLFDIVAALYTNTDPFTGKPLADPIMDDTAEYVEKVLAYAWRQFVPALTPGGTSWNKLQTAVKNYFNEDEPILDYAGRPVSLATAVLDTILGVKLSPIDEHEVMRRKKAMWEKAKKSFRDNIAKRREEVKRGLMKEEEFYEKAKQYKETLRRVARDLRLPGYEEDEED